MMPKKKSQYRIVPTNHEKLGSCWALKQGDNIIGTFINKQSAEKKKTQLLFINKYDFFFNWKN